MNFYKKLTMSFSKVLCKVKTYYTYFQKIYDKH